MTSSSAALYARYQPYRRWFEIGFWLVSALQSSVINSVIAVLDIRRAHLGFAAWQPVVWETSSSLLYLALMAKWEGEFVEASEQDLALAAAKGEI